jgi:hypothetical protein
MRDLYHHLYGGYRRETGSARIREGFRVLNWAYEDPRDDDINRDLVPTAVWTSKGVRAALALLSWRRERAAELKLARERRLRAEYLRMREQERQRERLSEGEALRIVFSKWLRR